MPSLLLATVMTKQLGAAVWRFDSNDLASFQHRGTSCYAIVSQSLATFSWMSPKGNLRCTTL